MKEQYINFEELKGGGFYCISWVQDALKDFKKRNPQKNLFGNNVMDNDRIYTEIVFSTLNATKYQAERDDQESIIKTALKVGSILFPEKHLNYEGVRRKVQYVQNTLQYCPVSELEKKIRNAKQNFVRSKYSNNTL